LRPVRPSPDFDPLMPHSLGLAVTRASTPNVMEEIDAAGRSFNYVCRRCDVWGRIPAGVSRRCWLCERADRLDRR